MSQKEEYSILLDQLKEKIQRLEITEERYEKIRKFDPRQFSALYSAAGQSMVGFDDMLDRWESRCQRCGGEMKDGVATEQTCTGEFPDFVGGGAVTMPPGGPGRQVKCLKCAECAWSVTV